MRFKVCAALVCLLASIGGARADLTAEINPEMDWTHKESGWTFPARIGDLKRTHLGPLAEFAEGGVAVTYESEKDSTLSAEIVVYRSALPGSDVWMDEVFQTYEDKKSDAEKEKLSLSSFELKGKRDAKGLMILHERVARLHPDQVVPSRMGLVSALLAAGQWRMDVMLSASKYFDSQTASDFFAPTQVENKFGPLIQALAGGKYVARDARPSPTAFCPDAMSFDEATPIEHQADAEAQMRTILMDLFASSEKKPVCREKAEVLRQQEIYRWRTAKDGYVVIPGKEMMVIAVTKTEPASADGPYAALLINPEMVRVLGYYDRMPSPAQVEASMKGYNPYGVSKTEPLPVISRSDFK